MAVIQDLPPELLARILEHLSDDPFFVLDSHSTSLVARAWRYPSQVLRRRVAVLCVARPPVQNRNPAYVACCVLREYVPPANRAQELLEQLNQHKVAVHTLCVEYTRSNDLDISRIRPRVLVGELSTLLRLPFAP